MAGGGGRIEFVEPPAAVRQDPRSGGGGSRVDRPRVGGLAVVAFAVVVLCGVGVVARWVGRAPEPVVPPPGEVAVAAGAVPLPPGFGRPVALASAGSGAPDVLWVLGTSGRIARVADGTVTASTSGTVFTALAARPDGRGVFAATVRVSPAVVALDPFSLAPLARVLSVAPVDALAAGVGSVWAASTTGVQGWTTDLRRELRPLRLPPEVTAVRSLAVVGPRLQARVTTSPGTTALLRLETPGGAPRLSGAFTGPVSVVPGEPALVAHVGPARVVEVERDPAAPGSPTFVGPLPADATIWPVTGGGAASWAVASAHSAALDCYAPSGELVGRMSVGNEGRSVLGPVLTTDRAVYAVTADDRLARGGHGSCRTSGDAR